MTYKMANNYANDESRYFHSRPMSERAAEGAILIMISIGATIGNISLWIIICRSRELRTITNSFVLCLATADLLVSVINMPITALTVFQGEWILGRTMCSVSGYLNMLTLVASVMSLCNISISRYIMVCKPIFSKRLYTPAKTAAMITVCWAVSALLSMPPLLGWSEYGYNWKQSFCFCIWPKSKSYAFFMIGACFGIPFSVMTICNILLFRTVHASKRKVISSMRKSQTPTRVYNELTPTKTSQDMTVENTKDETGINEIQSSENLSDINDTARQNVSMSKEIQMRRKSKRSGTAAEEIRLAVVLAIFVVVFIICWLPFCISMIISIFWPDQVSSIFHMSTLLIGYFNSGCNPVIYGVMNKKLAEGYRHLFCSCFFSKFKRSANSKHSV